MLKCRELSFEKEAKKQSIFDKKPLKWKLYVDIYRFEYSVEKLCQALQIPSAA